MAIVTKIKCIKCGESRVVAHGANSMAPCICTDCVQKKALEDKKLYLDGLKKLSLEKRISRLEELMYEAPWESAIRIRDIRF